MNPFKSQLLLHIHSDKRKLVVNRNKTCSQYTSKRL